MGNENEKWIEEIEEVRRFGKYNKGETRPMRIKFRSEVTAKEVLSVSWKLNKETEYSKIYLRKDLNKEERENLKIMLQEARNKNESRSEEEKESFFWKVKDMKIKKWFFNKKE